MDEQLVFPILEILLRKLQFFHKQNVPLGRRGADSIELEKLEAVLNSIKAVLLDVEKKQLQDTNVRRWLKELKDACYDAEDTIEEFETEALHYSQLNIARKVCVSFSKLPSLCSTLIDSKQIKEIRERLDAIKVHAYNFIDFNRNVPRKRETITLSSLVVASHDVFERDEDKEEIIKRLMQNHNVNVDNNIIAISGPSGVGKTTLAKLVYKDQRIDENFDIKMWVCLPHKYFAKKIIIDMIYSATGRIENKMEIDQLQQVLQGILKGKRYLLVLDEFVSNSNMNWTKFESLLSAVGAKERKIIIITNYGVDLSKVTYQLVRLSRERNLSLFMKYAFKERKEKHPRLMKIGEEIATKCAFLPLLVKLLGSILYFSNDEADWKYVRDSIKRLERKPNPMFHSPWNYRPETKKQKKPDGLSVLKLGYDLLPSHLKQCFVYCSVFPKDHGLNNITLIQFWMAHGLLQSDEGNEEPESIGMRYINELRCRCFFQDFEHKFDFITFKMHQLVHDLATEIAKNECIIIDSRRTYYSHGVYRHLSVVEADSVQEKVGGSKLMRSILFFEMIRPSQSLIESCISKFPNLRVLDFRNSDMEVLPESIGKLKHLRYLNLTQNIRIKRLPKSIFMMRSLETLLLGGCKVLEELPIDIRCLVNLRMLVFSSKQTRLPKNGIGCLTSLRCLGIVSCLNLEYLFQDIGGLQALRTLIIGDCPKLVSLPPNVKDLSSLENLMISNSKKSAKCNLKMEMGLQSIKLHLRMLCIDGLPEVQELPQWLLQCSANALQWLAIKNCPKFEGLHAEQLQILKSLEVLEIWNCPKFSSFPEGMHGLTAMRELKVRNCLDLSKRCKQDTGEDRPKINHIPVIELHDNLKINQISKIELHDNPDPEINHIPKIELHDNPKNKLDEHGYSAVLEFPRTGANYKNEAFRLSLPIWRGWE